MSDFSTAIARFRDSDMWWSFRRSPLTVAAALITLVYFVGAAFAPWVSFASLAQASAATR